MEPGVAVGLYRAGDGSGVTESGDAGDGEPKIVRQRAF